MSSEKLRKVIWEGPMDMQDINRVIIETAAEGIVVTSEKGIVLFANSRMLEMFGYTESELVGQSISVLVPNSVRPSHGAHIDKFSNNKARRSMGAGMNLSGQRKDGTQFPVEISLNYGEEKGQKFIIALVSDITRRKEMENALEEANNSLEQKVEERTHALEEALEKVRKAEKEAKRLLAQEKELGELKSRFVAMASHEFRTPLSGVMTSTSLIDKYLSLNKTDKIAKHTQSIKGSVHSLTNILNDFLSLEKLETNNVKVTLQPLSLSELINDSIANISAVLKTGQVVLFDPKGVNTIQSDKVILKTVINNLISNAVKYSGEYQEVEIQTKEKDDRIELSVTDHGIGIPEKDQKHMFELFFRAGNVTNISGTGLGLNIVKKQLELIDGTITFTSKVDVGTTFIITLPK